MELTKKIISSKSDTLPEYFSKIWQYRSLITLLAYREISGKFKNTKTGLLTVFFQPLVYVFVYTVFFDNLIKLDISIPYPLFAFTGVIGWLLFSNVVMGIGSSLQDSQNLITKVYFPKIILPLAKILVGLFEFCVSLIILGVLMAILTHGSFGIYTLLFPLFVLLNITVAFSIGIWISALSYKHRDLNHIIPHIIGFGIWFTPVFYPATLIPDQFQFLMFMNPIAGIIDFYRWFLLDYDMPSLHYLFSFIPVILLLIAGVLYFKRVEDKVVDYA